MSQPCTCQFCIDYKRFKQVLPIIPLEHREWFESVFDARWNAEEELSYKKAILDGSWPESVTTLEHALWNAKRKMIELNNQLKAEATVPFSFDCKVCEKCGKPMTSKQYWAHPCNNMPEITEPPLEHPDYVDDPPVDEDNLPEDMDLWYGDHQSDFF